MLKWIGIVVVVLALAYLGLGYLYSRSLRHAGFIEGRARLKMAAKELTSYGLITNDPSDSYRVWQSTNIVVIGGTQYHCRLEVGGGKFYDFGTLAMTTNETFVWLDSKRPPKIIEPGYKPPLFPPRF